MVVESVRVHMHSSQHVVILKDVDRDLLPIWIGVNEADAIARRLQGIAQRPLTHDPSPARWRSRGRHRSRLGPLGRDLPGLVLKPASGPSSMPVRPASRRRCGSVYPSSPRTRSSIAPVSPSPAERLSVFREFVNSLEDESGRAPAADDVSRARPARRHGDRAPEPETQAQAPEIANRARTTLRLAPEAW